MRSAFLKAVFLLFNLLVLSQGKKGKSGTKKENCQQYWEWTLSEDMVINDEQYYGFVLKGSTGTFTLPLYDNIELEGGPVARVRGSMVEDLADGFTANAAVYFFEDQDFVGVHLSYTYDPTVAEDFIYGFITGGTGKYKYESAEVTTVVVAEAPKYTVEWTFCY